MKSRGSSRSRRPGSEGLKSQEEKATFNSSLDLRTQETWGRRGNAAMGEPATQSQPGPTYGTE